MEQKKKVYTVEEVREILGIGKNKAYELCNNQTFPVLRIGSRILIPIRTFEDWLYSGAVLQTGFVRRVREMEISYADFCFLFCFWYIKV